MTSAATVVDLTHTTRAQRAALPLSADVAEVIAEELDALVCDTHDEHVRGEILGRASGIMATLVTLDAGMQRQVIPFDTFALEREAHRPRLPADVAQ